MIGGKIRAMRIRFAGERVGSRATPIRQYGNELDGRQLRPG